MYVSYPEVSFKTNYIPSTNDIKGTEIPHMSLRCSPCTASVLGVGDKCDEKHNLYWPQETLRSCWKSWLLMYLPYKIYFFKKNPSIWPSWWLISLVAQTLKNLPIVQETQVWSLDWEDPLEKGMTVHSSILAWSIPWTEEPGGLQSMGLQRVGHDWATHTHTWTLYFNKKSFKFCNENSYLPSLLDKQTFTEMEISGEQQKSTGPYKP